jgi:hypothetical protein
MVEGGRWEVGGGQEGKVVDVKRDFSHVTFVCRFGGGGWDERREDDCQQVVVAGERSEGQACVDAKGCGTDPFTISQK